MKRKSNKGQLEADLLMLEKLGVPKPVREHMFAAVNHGRSWRFDYAWPEQKIAVEYHGMRGGRNQEYGKGAHTRVKGFTGDREKVNAAQCLGWTVLEFTPAMIGEGMALDIIHGLFQEPREVRIWKTKRNQILGSRGGNLTRRASKKAKRDA